MVWRARALRIADREVCMLFSETLSSMRAQDAGWSAEIGEDWSQGRSTFGGMVAALGNEGMRRLVPKDRQLRALETVFVGPAFAGTVRIEADVLRTGKFVTIASARMWSGDAIAATLTGVYGSARSTAISVLPQAEVGVPSVLDLPDSSFPPHLGGPGFLQHFALRFAEGTRPFTGTKLSRSKVYVRHRDPAALTESHLVALIDCIPSPVVQMMTKPAPSSSLTWAMQFLRHDYTFAPDAWWRIDTEINSAGDGYSCESSVVLDPAGAPAVFSRQLGTVYG
jgi:acyl-CoA thioesterase